MKSVSQEHEAYVKEDFTHTRPDLRSEQWRDFRNCLCKTPKPDVTEYATITWGGWKVVKCGFPGPLQDLNRSNGGLIIWFYNKHPCGSFEGVRQTTLSEKQ